MNQLSTYAKVTGISFFLLVLLSACHKIPRHADYIPKDALLVGAVDVNKLTKKMIWNAITGSVLFEEMQKEIQNEKSKEAMKDISAVGLNQNSTVYFFYTGNLRRDGKICFLLGMKDRAQFEKFVKESLPGVAIQDKGKYHTAHLEESVYAAWNEEAAMFFPLKNTSTDSVLAEGGLQTEVNALASIEAFVAGAFTVDKDKSVTALPHFKELQKSHHDVSFWANYEEIFRQNPDLNSSEVQAFIKKDYFTDAALATGIDFEDGTVAIQMDYYMSPELADIYDKHTKGEVDDRLLRQIPSNDVALIAAYHFKPQMIEEFLKQFKLDGLANLGLGMMGTSLEKIGSAFKGDMVLSLTDINVKDTVKQIPNTDVELVVEPDMNVSVAVSIADQSSMDDLLGKGVKQNVLSRKGTMYTMGEGAFVREKDLLVYSSDPKLAQTYCAGSNDIQKSLPEGAWKQLAGHPFCFYVNVKKIMQFVSDADMSTEDRELFNETVNMFTYMEMHGGRLKNKANHMEGNVFFTNRKENSLIQLLNLAMKVKKSVDAKENQVPPADSTGLSI